MEEMDMRMRAQPLQKLQGFVLEHISIQQSLLSTKAMSKTIKAGLLACNVSTVLPIPCLRNSGQRG